MTPQYFVFAGESYYPGGGWQDYKGAVETIEQALTLVANIDCDWWQIVLIGSLTIEREGRRK